MFLWLGVELVSWKLRVELAKWGHVEAASEAGGIGW